jgi:hypothetical protein
VKEENGSKQAIMLPKKYWKDNGIPSGALCSNRLF